MANILVTIEKGIEKGVEVSVKDALKWLTGVEKVIRATPAAIAALAILVELLDKPLLDMAGVAANPLNIPLEIQTAHDLQAAWPQVKVLLKSLGVKF